jgi:hypothetical protein
MIHRIILLLLILYSFTATAHAATFNLPDSGQTKCYQAISPYAEIPCVGTGQDGAYSINPMSFADNGNGTITDNNTSLVWQKCSVGQNNDAACSGTASTYNWYQASGTYDAGYNSSTQNVCGSLALAGGGWRLPSKKELTDIVDYSIPYPGPMIQQTWFPNTVASDYWSSTTYAGNPGYAWSVDFVYGGVYYGDLYMYVSLYVRCVRGGQ